MDPSLEAAQSQGTGGYGVDQWMNIKLEPMMKVWQGIGGHSNFFLSEQDAREAMGTFVETKPFKFAETLWRLAQVQPNEKHGFRLGIREFVVDLPVMAAVGICTANPDLGSGSVLQYYIPDWERYLMETGREYQFNEKGYPSLLG